MRKISQYSVIMGFFAISACVSQTSVQSGYVDQRDECRELAVLKQELYVQEATGLSRQDQNAQLLTLFGHCMYERGWTVAAPVKKAAPPAEPLPGSQLQVPVTPAAAAAASGMPVSDAALNQTPEEEMSTAPATNEATGRQAPAENDVDEGIAVPSSNVPIQTPF